MALKSNMKFLQDSSNPTIPFKNNSLYSNSLISQPKEVTPIKHYILPSIFNKYLSGKNNFVTFPLKKRSASTDPSKGYYHSKEASLCNNNNSFILYFSPKVYK